MSHLHDSLFQQSFQQDLEFGIPQEIRAGLRYFQARNVDPYLDQLYNDITYMSNNNSILLFSQRSWEHPVLA